MPFRPLKKQLYIGSAFYPEHWPESRWIEDIKLMKTAGFTVARMAEFAWSSLETSAGKFEFDWLERAIQLLAENEIMVVLGTPTAAPPAWLVHSKPEIMAVDEYGRRVQFGNRCHYCVNSIEFQQAVRRLVNAMAQRFGSEPNVIGWQIDNEFQRVCYCPRCQKLFQKYLSEKYKTLDMLNEHWSTNYWSQTYSAFEQIPIPVGPHNPGLMLEFKHFVTDSYRKFQNMQISLLRQHLSPEVWVTHNFMGWFDGIDYYDLSTDLDMASWDWYVGPGHNDYLFSGAIHDLTRGLKRKNFWVMETQPLSVNWKGINNALNKGEASAMAWHAIAHGADAVLYWQWRSALGGQEQYHGTLVDQSGQPRPFYSEAQILAAQIDSVSALMAGSKVKAKVAMLNSYDSRWSAEFQRHHKDFDYVNHFNHYYKVLAANNISVDIISSEAELGGYNLVIAPSLLVQSDAQVANMTRFVQAGGKLVLTIRTGMKDPFNALLPARQPGALAKLAGVEVEEFFALDAPVPVEGNLFKGTSSLWAERLKILDKDFVIPMAHYGKSNGWLDGQLAVAVHPFGKGMVYTIGAYLDDAAQQVLMNQILKFSQVEGISSPKGVEIATRWKEDGIPIYFVINHTASQTKVSLPWTSLEHLSNHIVEVLELQPYGVAILTRSS